MFAVSYAASKNSNRINMDIAWIVVNQILKRRFVHMPEFLALIAENIHIHLTYFDI